LTPQSGGVAGAWLGYSTLASAAGGECVGAALQGGVDLRDVFTTAIRQNGATLQATVASQGNGTLCAYTGSTAAGTVTLTLTSCQADRISSVSCAAGVIRDVQLMASTLTATVDTQKGTGIGRETSSWTVFPSGSTSSAGTLTTTATFSWRFLGLPPSDYHVFTGTIFPGYDDGTISIPADPTPFCVLCGWFVR